jgi:hypothetical protein
MTRPEIDGGCLAGVNLPVLRGAYNHDLAPNLRYPDWGCEFSPLWAFRYLALCRLLGLGAVRIWLCEDGEGVRTDRAGRAEGVLPELLDAVSAVQDGAELLGLKLAWTFLDGNAWRRNGDVLTGLVAGDRGEALRFAERVAAPVAARLRPATTFALEVLNEPESVSGEVLGPDGLPWETIVASIRVVRGVLHEALPGVPVTCGTQAVFLPGLLAGVGPGREGDAPVDAVDLHVYHPDGGLPSREDLPVDIGSLPLWAGECGLSHRGAPNSSGYLVHYLYNAAALGYRAVFLWKLEGDEHLVRRAPVTGAQPGTEAFSVTAVGAEVRDLLTSDEWAALRRRG